MEINKKIGKYRWTICSLVFFATTVNYLDRQVLSLLKDNLEVQFNWSDSDYANIVSVFQFVYAISMLFAGRLIDWLGTKMGYAWSLIIWSFAAMSHALARGTGGFMIARGLLGFGESGNFPAAIKTVAEWFPKKERALATGYFQFRHQCRRYSCSSYSSMDRKAPWLGSSVSNYRCNWFLLAYFLVLAV